MSYYARGALISDVQAPRSNWQAFGIYGEAHAYWLAREPTFTPSQLEELDLEYVREQDLPFALSHYAAYRPSNRPAANPVAANPPRASTSKRGLSGKRHNQLVGRTVASGRIGNY